jgi:hypothetical protein
MHLCYVDESGVPEIPGNSSHFVLAGIAIPIERWREADSQISAIMARYGLASAELHTAWILRNYLEQSRIDNFVSMPWDRRRTEVIRARTSEIYRVRRLGEAKKNSLLKKNYAKTDAYIHLTLEERRRLVGEVAQAVGRWNWARLFAECIDKIHFDPSRTQRGVGEQAFEQMISRFERFLQNSERPGQKNFGLIIHDNNQTIAAKHTQMMRNFHAQGTLWTNVTRIMETPLFVGSDLTRMVQIADLCSYALRRYLENNETALFDSVFVRADRILQTVVGVRHFTHATCGCHICAEHRRVTG